MLSRHFVRAVAIGVSISAATSAGAEGVVKVGMVMPMTGALAAAGQQVLAGARLYMKQHGETVAGKKIELIVKDDASSGETGKRLIQELIVNDKVDVIGGGLTADLMPSAPLFTETKKPAVIMLSSTTTVVEKSPFSCGRVARWRNPQRSWPIGRSRPGLPRPSHWSPSSPLAWRPRKPSPATTRPGVARLPKPSACRCATRILLLFCSGWARRHPRLCSYSSPRCKPGPSPSNSSSAA